MYLFYIDESGTRDTDVGKQADGSVTKDWLYVLTAVGIFEHRWKDFYKAIVKRKRELLARIKAVHGIALDLDSTEIKSNWIRIPKERTKHPFLSQLTNADLEALVALYSHFQPVLDQIYRPRADGRLDGLKLFPSDTPLQSLLLQKTGNEKGRSGEQPDLPLN